MLRILMLVSFMCSLDLLNAHPVDEPTKIVLGNIQNNVENRTSSKLEDTKQINKEFRYILDPLITKSDKAQSRRSIPPVQSTTPIVLFSPTPQEKVRLENDTAQAILERRQLDNIRRVLNSFLTPKPLVDRIRNEEKYGNTGDKFIGIGRAVVSGYENLSNFLNTLTDFPVGFARQTSEGITQTLNKLGARIIGLQ